MRVRFAPLLFLLAAPLHAELLATFQTSQGNVTVALQYDKAPQTVANFITLAEGSRARVDPRTGALTSRPLYTGEKFFRVINETGRKIAQTGSGTGSIAGGPGYTFRDEFDPTLLHLPYVLSMENSTMTDGVHTNGSQICLTGNIAIPARDNVHTVFGVITDLASRSTVDAILAAGTDATTIQSVTFVRTDPAAVAFDEFEQNLPECQPVPGHLAVTPGTAADYVFHEPLKPGTVFHAFRSTDLVTWEKPVESYHGTGQPGPGASSLDDASRTKAFYQLSMVTYPDALAPASLANRTLKINLAENQSASFAFDATGEAGTATFIKTETLSYSFTLGARVSSPYKATWEVDIANLGVFRIRGILDGEKPDDVLGTHVFEEFNGSWSAIASGGLQLSKPSP